jgi:tetratricopeptide (TPR) repeat protein
MCEAVLLEDTDPSAAFEYYAQLLNYTEQMSKPSVEFLLHRVSKVAITIKDYDNALHALDTLSSSFSPSYTPQYAEMLYLVGRKEESLNRYEQYIGQFPDDIDTIFRLADLQKKEGNSDLARGLYKHILSKDPSYTAAKKQLDALAISDGQKLANLFR